jgi:undecaprenyl-diphosphatase
MITFRDQPRLSAPPILVLVVAVLVFALMAVVAAAWVVVPGDDAVLGTVQELPATPFEGPIDVGNRLGDTIAGPIAVIILTILCAVRRFTPGIVFCLTLLALRLGGMFMKGVFDSPRPDPGTAEIRDHFDGFGFPSGHAMTATCIAMAVTIILPALFRESGLIRSIVAVVWCVAALCGVARVWYGAHWPTDVLGGAASAVVMAWIAVWLGSLYQARSMKSAIPATSAASDNQRSITSR